MSEPRHPGAGTPPASPPVNHTPERPPAQGWYHFQHAADIGICGLGASLAVAFEQAALAMTAVMVPPERIAATEEVIIECQAPDPELLLADWLNALILEMATRKWIFSRFAVRIEADHLYARAWGEPLDPRRHRPAVEVKGATYTELSVVQTQTGWRACCVVDV